MADPILGINAKIYYGAAGSTATNELTNIMDVTFDMSKGEADVTTRGSGGWRSKIGTLKEGSVEFDMIWDSDDAGFTAIKDAFFDDTAIALLILDEAGGEGLDADFSILKFERGEPLEDALKVSVSASVTASSRTPTWTE